MFSTFIRRSNDGYLYDWAYNLAEALQQKKNYDVHYIGYGQFDFDQNHSLIEKITTGNNIAVFCFDFLVPETIQQIQDKIDVNVDANLLWIGAQENVFKHERIKTIFWPCDMLLQINEYGQLEKIDKLPSNNKHWISTSLGIRQHRIYMASLLKGLGMDDTGDLRIKTVSRMGPKAPNMSEQLAKGNGLAPDGQPSLPEYVKDKWHVPQDKMSIEAINGYKNLITKKWWGSSIFTYKQYIALGDYHGSNDAGNFDKYLRHLYRDKTLEIVNETSHGSDPVFLTEKFINGVFGMNFIIINGAKGTIKILEDLGWNSCRHVIDHGYDEIDDPIDRCEQAVRKNKKILSDPEYCNNLWNENLAILEYNRYWAKDILLRKVLEKCHNTALSQG